MMKLAAALFTCFSTIAVAQSPEVPHKMQFAGMTLTIRDDARREIQQDVDLLTKSPQHVAIKAERAKTYFPLIEKVFEEERVPDDFKYLVLQESALISDAVSTSNAVGFWQFKDFTAIEMGLRVDREVDERMNIVSSSRAAAKYLKKNNIYFNNWLYALQAYQMGAGGVLQSVKDHESGTKHMEITSKTYWYVKKFLAHKVAYEEAVKGPGAVKVITLVNHQKKSMEELAREFALQEDELKSYNKWVRTEYIPGDKPYMVAIPTAGDGKALSEAIASASKTKEQPARVNAKPPDAKNEIVSINGIAAMKALAGETSSAFVTRAGIDLAAFLKSNDISVSEKLIAGNFYYLKKKKTKASVPQHVAQPGENLWTISQQYGVQLRKLQKYNGLTGKSVAAGTVVFLSGKKYTTNPASITEVAEVDASNTFNWSVESEPVVDMITPQPETTSPSPIETEQPVVDSSANLAIDVIPVSHVVAQGETLYSIARKYHLPVMDIAQWNKLKIEEGIKPGQVISLQAPALQVPNPTEIIHQVKTADTLYSVARQYNVTIKELMDWNQKKDFTLAVGENLKILKKQ
ncbi:MAG TPA: LysM peptidoglycan-binding domain-containing protein [Cyclobacteriaceae bacterium]|nr:LysM peptidoglycan-binding domain-containing protein [Cyclobacteriaceae bacterium]